MLGRSLVSSLREGTKVVISSVLLAILLAVVHFGIFLALIYAVSKFSEVQQHHIVTIEHNVQTLHRQYNYHWNQWVTWEMGKCLVNHYPHMAEAKECMLRRGIFI